MTPWLDVIGIGENGWDGLMPPARARLEAAEVIVGGDRHHGLAPHLNAERIVWPSPFRALADEIGAWRGRRVVVLVTGDPLWYSVGAIFQRFFDPKEITYYPNLSAFQLAAARMKWSLADLETLTIHGRPAEQAIPFFGAGQRLLILAQDSGSPAKVASLLRQCGLGDSRLTVLAAMGGADERRIEGLARDWQGEVPDFHVLAVECAGASDGMILPRTGLPDDAFQHDGMLTKRELRVLTLAALAPRRAELLWDVGVGCGSVAIEWMRSERDMRSIGIDSDSSRLAMAAANAVRLGAPRVDLRTGRVPDALMDLPQPDAVFFGGGLSLEAARIAMKALAPHGRLVANAVTLETETLLTQLHAQHGGQLVRVAVSRAGTVGEMRAFKPMMPVTQWSYTK